MGPHTGGGCSGENGVPTFRRFFAATCMHSIPPDRQELFNRFLGEIAPRIGNENREQQREWAYQHLEYIFRQWDTTCRANGLEGPLHYNEAFVEQDSRRDLSTEFVADDPDAHQTCSWWRRYADGHLRQVRRNAGQSAAFDRIIGAVECTDPNAQRLFRLKGEGGTGEWSG